MRSAQDGNQACAEVEPGFLGGHSFLRGEKFLRLLVALGSGSRYFMLRLSSPFRSNASAVGATFDRPDCIHLLVHSFNTY